MDAGALLDILGNENRRRILRLISRKPCYVTEISEHLGVSPKAVIDHLRKLEEAGLVESRTDDKRRKYFHIAENLRLEVTVAPYAFGMKSAYPASPNLDISTCQHLSLETHELTVETGTVRQNGGTTLEAPPDVDPGEIATLASYLDELDDIERELSLAQRWVQGRISTVLERLAEAVEDDSFLDAEILAAVAGGETDTQAISDEVDVPPSLVEERLQRLADVGVVSRSDAGWRLTDR
jgi:ArsR family transcriptional regulator